MSLGSTAQKLTNLIEQDNEEDSESEQLPKKKQREINITISVQDNSVTNNNITVT